MARPICLSSISHLQFMRIYIRKRHPPPVELSKEDESGRAMRQAPHQPPGPIPIRRRNPLPCKSKAPVDQRQPPLYTVLSNISEMSKGATVTTFPPPRPIFYFFRFFCFAGPAWGFGDQHLNLDQRKRKNGFGETTKPPPGD